MFNEEKYEYPAYCFEPEDYRIFTNDERVLKDGTPGRTPIPEHETQKLSRPAIDLTDKAFDQISFILCYVLNWTRNYKDGQPLGASGRNFESIKNDLIAANKEQAN